MAGTISWKIGNGDCAVVMFSLPYDFNLYSNWLSVGIMKESKNLNVLKGVSSKPSGKLIVAGANTISKSSFYLSVG